MLGVWRELVIWFPFAEIKKVRMYKEQPSALFFFDSPASIENFQEIISFKQKWTALSFLSLSCTKVIKALEEKQNNQKQKIVDSSQSADEVSKYADCIANAETDEHYKECESIKSLFSENTKRIMEKSKARQ